MPRKQKTERLSPKQNEGLRHLHEGWFGPDTPRDRTLSALAERGYAKVIDRGARSRLKVQWDGYTRTVAPRRWCWGLTAKGHQRADELVERAARGRADTAARRAARAQRTQRAAALRSSGR